MLFTYKALTQEGASKEGTIESTNEDVAIRSLQQRGLTIVSIRSAEKRSFLSRQIAAFEKVALKDVVMMSRQMATLFVANVSALRIFRMLAAQSENAILRKNITTIADDIQGGSSISGALAKHPQIFSPFYINMVKSGEETGKLSEIFESLASYLDRSYELTVKTRNALIYPGFVIGTFTVVMILMLTVVFPNLAAILEESNQPIPLYTRFVIGMSDFLVHYGFFLLALVIVGVGWVVRYTRTDQGKIVMSHLMLNLPLMGALFRKLYLSRIADNLYTLLTSGISIVRALEITASVVGNAVYEDIVKKSKDKVSSGVPLSDALGEYEEIPLVMVQIIKVGEETGELGNILKTLSTFYKREVDTAVDTLIDLIEPILIVALGLGVGLILTSVLIPIYNISTGV